MYFSDALWCIYVISVGVAIIMAVVKRGFTVTRTPMAQLFEGATGELRTVLMNEAGVETAGGTPYHCVQDAIKYICEVNDTRAACIWNYDVNAETKAQLSNNRTFMSDDRNSNDQKVALREFVFHRKPIPVVTFSSLLILISRLNSGRANAFKERFTAVFKKVLAGDQTLHDLIDHNAQSTAPLQAFARGQLPGQPALQAPDAVGAKRLRDEQAMQVVLRVNAGFVAQMCSDKMAVLTAEQKLLAAQDRSAVKRAKLAIAAEEQLQTSANRDMARKQAALAFETKLGLEAAAASAVIKRDADEFAAKLAERELVRRQTLLECEEGHDTRKAQRAEQMSKLKLETEVALAKLAGATPATAAAPVTTGLLTVYQLAAQLIPQWKHLSVTEQASLVNEVGRGVKNLAAPIDKINETTPMGTYPTNRFAPMHHDQIVEALQARLAKTSRGKQIAQPRGINLYFAPT